LQIDQNSDEDGLSGYTIVERRKKKSWWDKEGEEEAQ
jgi:hypothetical protein